MKVDGRSVIRALGRSLLMAGATAVALILYRVAQDAGGKAFDRHFATLPELPDPPGDTFFFTFWIILPAVLAALAVAVPAMRLRLSPRAVFVWTMAVPTVAVATCFPRGVWWDSLAVLGLPSLVPVLLLALVLSRSHRRAWMRHELRSRKHIAREITI